MVCGDQTHIDPAEYFHPDVPLPEIPLVNKLWFPVGIPVTLLGCVIISNVIAKKPKFSGIQKHILAVTGGALFGNWLDKFVIKRTARRDAIIYHYIITHPEDFPPVERVKYKDVLNMWVPARFW